MFICLVFPDSTGLWGELLVRGNFYILGGLESRLVDGLLTALLACFSGWGVSGRIIWLCWLKGGWSHCGTSSFYCMIPGAGFKTSKEAASQRLQAHRTTSLVHLLCLCRLCFSNLPHKANRFQVKSELVSSY